MNQSAENYFTNSYSGRFSVSYQSDTKGFEDICYIEDLYNYLDQVYFPSIYTFWNSTTSGSSSATPAFTTESIRKIYSQNMFVGEPVVRMTLRRYQMTHLGNLVPANMFISLTV